jgi:hypothetical protein
MAWQCISPEVNVKGLRNAEYPKQWERLMICYRMAVKRMGI